MHSARPRAERASETPAADALPSAWSALVEDCGVSVVIFDDAGRILFVNESAAREFGKPTTEILGRSYGDLLPKEFADERLGYFRRVATTGNPLVIDHTFGGCRRRTSLRPFPSDAAGNRRILMVCRPAMEADQQITATCEVVRAKANDLGVLSSLTPRELEILCLIGQGMATADIARHLHRSEKTVEWHRVSLGNKLGVSNRVELARIAIRSGLINSAVETKADHAG
jgi:PAS domain S-box-containing protein